MRKTLLSWGGWSNSSDTTETKPSYYPFPLGWLIKKRGISSRHYLNKNPTESIKSLGLQTVFWKGLKSKETPMLQLTRLTCTLLPLQNISGTEKEGEIESEKVLK